MTPLTMIGDVSMDSFTSVWKIQATRSLPTLAGVICVLGEKRFWV